MIKLTPETLRGSLLRCLCLTDHPACETAKLLTNLVGLQEVAVSSDDHWMPRGLRDHKETMLTDTNRFLPSDKRESLVTWWLDKPRGAKLPNWDIASTCRIGGGRGLLLVEAKAHDNELSVRGKSSPRTANGWANHDRIALAISEANSGLNYVLSGWALSRDSHYQLSNRFAWAWKLAALRVPVILVYLGFINAEEMGDQGQPFASSETWHTCIRRHAAPLVPDSAWNRRLDVDGTPLWFLIRSMHVRPEVID